MDMASGKVYFWDSATDEVAWEPPPGAQPRSKQDNAATFAAHVSATDTPSAGTAGTAGAAADAAAHADGPAATGIGEVQASDAAGTGDVAVDRQAASTSEGSPAHTGPPSGEEDREEGQLAEVRSASRSPPLTPPLTNPQPLDPQLGVLGQQVVDQIRQSTHRLCRNIPQLVRLAVEAEIRLQDWQMFSAKQQQAADSAQAQTAVTWTDIQDHLRWRWQSITASLPAALEEAQQLHTRMDQELEAGEMPPLPSEDSATGAQPHLNHTAGPGGASDPAEIVLLDSAPLRASTDDAQGPPTSGGDEGAGVVDPSAAPPLPAEDPSSIPIATAAGAVSPTSAGVDAADYADDDADMDLDMDVDADSGASRPVSAESTGQDGAAASSGAALPDWAGYYMAHGYAYPYYGEACHMIVASYMRSLADIFGSCQSVTVVSLMY